MKIAALRLHNVKRFAGRGVAIEGIGDGVNVLCAVNEFGKSTSFEALHALFFQPHTSTAGDVRSLRPYSGGSPVVEADIVTETGRFRITKQFYGRGSARVVDLGTGRLVAQADEAEAFVSGLVRGGTAGPAGLLWVRQGITGIERRSKGELDSEQQVRAGLLESVQGEVEAVTGGRRMAEIWKATEEELARLVTPTGRPRAGERYALAIEERDRLEAEERRLADEVARLRGALDRRAQARVRLAELERPEDRAERQKAVDDAEAACAAARTQAEALRAAEAELNLAREQHASAAREWKGFADALARAADLDARRQAAAQHRAAALEKRDAASQALAKARAAGDAAEQAEREAQSLLSRLDAALKAREAAERLAELEAQLERAAAAGQAIEDAEAQLVLVRIADRAVAELEAVETEIAKLIAVVEASRPSVSVAYEPGAPLVMLDGSPLPDGEARGYEGQAALAIPGIGIVTLRTNQARGSDHRLAEQEAKRRTLLASMGVEDLAAARARQALARQREGDIRELRARLAALAPEGLPKLREEVAGRRAVAGEAIEIKADPAAVRAELMEATTRRDTARTALRAAEPAEAQALRDMLEAETALAGLTAGQAQLDTLLGPHETRAERERSLRETQAKAAATLAGIEAKLAAQRAGARDLAAAEATLRRLRSVVDAAESDIRSLREDISNLDGQIAGQSDLAIEETWRETADALGAARLRVTAFEKEVAVLKRLCTALETARGHARETYLRPVMNELRPLLSLLFDDVAITFDERTLLPSKILRNGQEEEVDRLSGGMREQLSVLTRLAFARLLAKDGRPAPVILDDALVYSDDDRIEKMFDALHRQAREQQIIVFSCRQRAFQKLGGTVLRMVDWHPDPTG